MAVTIIRSPEGGLDVRFTTQTGRSNALRLVPAMGTVTIEARGSKKPHGVFHAKPGVSEEELKKEFAKRPQRTKDTYRVGNLWAF